MNLPALDAPLPASLDAERAVLGSLLLNNACLGRVAPLIGAEDFSTHSNQVIYGALSELIAEGEGDLLTLKEKLSKAEIKEAGGSAYISSLIDGIPDIANVERYAGIVKQKARERRLIKACSNAAQDLLYGTRSAGDVEETLMELAHGHQPEDLAEDAGKDAEAMARDSMQRFDERLGSPSPITGIASGYSTIDLYLYGWQRGAVALISGRSSVGKTTVGWNIAMKALDASPHIKVAYFSLEMTIKALEDRLLSMISGVKSHWIKTGLFVGPREMKAVEAASRRMRGWGSRLYANANPLSIHAVGAEARRLKKTQGLDILVIDYLQLCDGGEGDNREQELAFISRRLTMLAKQLDCSIIAMSQNNRSGLSKDERATAETVRGSDALMHDARTVIILDRPRMRDRDNQEKKFCELWFHFDKNSEGPVGAELFHFDYERFVVEEGECREGCREYKRSWAPEARQGSIDG